MRNMWQWGDHLPTSELANQQASQTANQPPSRPASQSSNQPAGVNEY